mmetsp:Transcript_8541/g.12947  ORF Transcript_8541/g.12947 Transcript_8541/m.12947 type:complete len:141 (+) Transcript_8541:27-449(+)
MPRSRLTEGNPSRHAPLADKIEAIRLRELPAEQRPTYDMIVARLGKTTPAWLRAVKYKEWYRSQAAKIKSLEPTLPTCVICDPLGTTTFLDATLPCGHKFHFECVNEWFQRVNACPLCRANVEYITRSRWEPVCIPSSAL